MDTNYLIILLLLLGLMASTVPVFMALFFTGFIGLVFMIGIDPQIVIEVLYRSMDKFALVVVLFFILCGNIMTTGSIVEKLIKTANCLVGFLPGGLAMAGVLACGFFGAISGSTVATVVAIGGFMIPALIENGYDEKFSVGLMNQNNRWESFHEHQELQESMEHPTLCLAQSGLFANHFSCSFCSS